MPSADDFPVIRSISLGLRPCPNNPLGAKGAGEGGLIATGGAVEVSGGFCAANQPIIPKQARGRKRQTLILSPRSIRMRN